jgi:hypothetical protein
MDWHGYGRFEVSQAVRTFELVGEQATLRLEWIPRRDTADLRPPRSAVQGPLRSAPARRCVQRKMIRED